MKSRGVTLIELMISLVMAVIIGTAVVSAFSTAVKAGPIITAANEASESQIAIEERLRYILSHAWINTSATDQTTFFTTNPVAPVATTGTTGTATAAATAAQQTGSGNNGAPGGGAVELVFTTLGTAPKSSALYNDDDFETSNTNRGPTGGLIEYGLALQPVGNAQNLKGVFIREQEPADTDPTQGGMESLLIPDIDTLSFEFWDGTEWETAWDTPNMTPRRLPAAVRVTYSIGGNNQHSFIVTLPNSDVTSSNPVATTGSTVTSTAGGSGA